jgi:hypothetical protein
MFVKSLRENPISECCKTSTKNLKIHVFFMMACYLAAKMVFGRRQSSFQAQHQNYFVSGDINEPGCIDT